MSTQRIETWISRSFPRLFAGYLCLVMAIPFVAHNSAAQTTTQLYSADAYGTYAFVGDIVETAKTAPVGVGPGCGTPQVGTSATGTVATVNKAPLVLTGVINTAASSAENMATASSDVHGINMLGGVITAQGTVNQSGASSQTSSTTQGVNLLGGLITADGCTT